MWISPRAQCCTCEATRGTTLGWKRQSPTPVVLPGDKKRVKVNDCNLSKYSIHVVTVRAREKRVIMCRRQRHLIRVTDCLELNEGQLCEPDKIDRGHRFDGGRFKSLVYLPDLEDPCRLKRRKNDLFTFRPTGIKNKNSITPNHYKNDAVTLTRDVRRLRVHELCQENYDRDKILVTRKLLESFFRGFLLIKKKRTKSPVNSATDSPVFVTH